MFDLRDFTVQKAVFEIRYAPAFLLWDNAGSIWHEVSLKYPEMKQKIAQPNEVNVSLNDTINAVIAIERSVLDVAYPEMELPSLAKACGYFLPYILKTLEIETLSRIGLRTFYEKVFQEKAAASDFVAEALDIDRNLPRDDYFGIRGKLRDPALARRWEGDTTGCLVQVRVQEQHLRIDIPKDFGNRQSIDEKRQVATVDIDMYTVAPTPVSRFSPELLIKSWLHSCRKDVSEFLRVAS